MTSRRARFASYALLITVLALGCSTSPEPDTQPFKDVTWKLLAIQMGDQTIPITSPEFYTLRFSSDTLVEGDNYCNTYYVAYRLEPSGAISFGPFATTKIGCPQPSNEIEFRAAFETADALSANDQALSLSYMGRTRALIFTKLQ